MCEINPTHGKKFVLEFWTSEHMTEQAWLATIMPMVLEMEMNANKSGKVRVHIHEMEDSHGSSSEG